MNIVQAYTKFKGQFIILISGFSGSGKTKVSKFIADLFKFQHINLSHFYYSKEIYDQDANYVKLKNKTDILNWDNIYESVDWDKFNATINNIKNKGVVAVGFGFPTKLLQFEPDFHIQIKISKQHLLENRENYIKSKMTSGKTHASDRIIDIDTDKNILNNITYPIHLKLIDDSKIDKYINTNDVSDEKIKEDTFNYLMDMVGKWLNKNSTNSTNSTNYTKSTNSTNYTKSANSINSKSSTFNNPESACSITSDNKTNKNSHQQIKGKPKVHYEGDASYYDEFYYPNSKRVLYDFNDEGVDYPEEYRQRFAVYNKSSDSDSSSLNSDLNSDSSSDSATNATYLYTRPGDEFNEDN